MVEGLATGVLGSYDWRLSQGTFNEIEWVAIAMEEPMPMSLFTAVLCVNSAETSLDTTAFMASWVVAILMEKSIGVSSLLVAEFFEVSQG